VIDWLLVYLTTLYLPRKLLQNTLLAVCHVYTLTLPFQKSLQVSAVISELVTALRVTKCYSFNNIKGKAVHKSMELFKFAQVIAAFIF